jgi:hypothetical protein
MQTIRRCWKVSIGSGTQKAATWLFVLSFLTLGVGRDHSYIEWFGIAGLGLVILVVLRLPTPSRAIYRIILTATALTLIICAYPALRSWPPSVFGSAHSYDTKAVSFGITYLVVGTFAALFFQEQFFVRVIWRAATVALWVGVISDLVSRLTHRLLLVSESHSMLRMQGTLTEPSAWASVITLVVLLAVRRRSLLSLALAAAGMALTASPTCIFVLAVTFPLYYALTGTRRQRVTVALVLACFIPAVLFFVHTAKPRQYLNSRNAAEITVGRLLSGIENVDTDGRNGHNTRFASTKVVIAEARENDWVLTGAGPAADDTFFPAKFPSVVPLLPDALWVSVLFDFGLIGVLLLGTLMVIAVWRMRHRPQMCAILLPFFVASLINSAEGSFEYGFVALGIMLFAFGWAGTSQVGDPSLAVQPGRPAVLEEGRARA